MGSPSREPPQHLCTPFESPLTLHALIICTVCSPGSRETSLVQNIVGTLNSNLSYVSLSRASLGNNALPRPQFTVSRMLHCTYGGYQRRALSCTQSGFVPGDGEASGETNGPMDPRVLKISRVWVRRADSSMRLVELECTRDAHPLQPPICMTHLIHLLDVQDGWISTSGLG